MDKMINELVEQCARIYQSCSEHMNKQSLKLIENNHRSKIMQECVYRETNFLPYLRTYEEKTGTGIK